jgi:hypothetical protein
MGLVGPVLVSPFMHGGVVGLVVSGRVGMVLFRLSERGAAGKR